MILVTGGTGLLGSHLLVELLKSDKPVRAIYRDSARRERVKKVFSYYTENPDVMEGRVEWVKADLLDRGSMEEAMVGVEEVYHAGAVVSFYPADHALMWRVNVRGTEELVNMALEQGVKKFCYVSSVATLGRAENDGESNEETHWVDSRKNSVYSQTKRAAEREVWRGIAEGLPAVIVLPSVILGPGYWHENSGLFRLVHDGLKYFTRGVNGYVDARDVARCMIQLMDREIFGERFIVSAENLSYERFFAMIAAGFHKPAPVFNVPPALTEIAWRVEALRSFFTGGKPEVTREMAVTTAQVYAYTHEKICRRLGFAFLSIEDTIQEICQHYLNDLTRETGSGSENSAG